MSWKFLIFVPNIFNLGNEKLNCLYGDLFEKKNYCLKIFNLLLKKIKRNLGRNRKKRGEGEGVDKVVQPFLFIIITLLFVKILFYFFTFFFHQNFF